jgi:predicted RNA binding protein YcfA (HicA-like mRNA interferase family)
MPKLPRVAGRQMATVSEKHGFSLSRQSGSHQIYKNAAGRRATIPFHAAKILHPKVQQGVMRDAGLSPEELEKLL